MKLLTLLFLSFYTLFASSISPIITYLLDDSGTLADTTYFESNSSVNVGNPDRGLYGATYALTKKRDYNAFEYAKDKGYSLVYASIELDNYLNTQTLDSEFLTIIENNLIDAQNAKIKLILRIQYRPSSNGIDASLSIIETHFSQLTPLLQEYKDVISIVQAGTIGAYGEWHSFTGEFADTDLNYIDNRKQIIELLHVIFPEKYIQIRTTMHKELLYGGSSYYREESNIAQLDQETATENTTLAKIAHHNDCFLASDTDQGTFASDNIEYWKNYMQNDSLYVPSGGETCANSSFAACTNAVAELKRFRYAFLNDDYHPDVLDRWKVEGCYEEIKENLGYRFVATNLKTQMLDENFTVKLEIKNEGYGSSYINYPIKYILKNEVNSVEVAVNDFDIRTLGPSGKISINANFKVQDIDSGTYCLYIKIAEVKLSNNNIWDEVLEANRLKCDIKFNL